MQANFHRLLETLKTVHFHVNIMVCYLREAPESGQAQGQPSEPAPTDWRDGEPVHTTTRQREAQLTEDDHPSPASVLSSESSLPPTRLSVSVRADTRATLLRTQERRGAGEREQERLQSRAGSGVCRSLHKAGPWKDPDKFSLST